ncbi:MAG: patatin-like phospholipase family protein, partial [Betaproteobacteria bacterium]
MNEPIRDATIKDVRDAEIDALKKSSEQCNLASGPFSESHLLGLAFSGGGIRSATFNLGVLQALAKIGLLKEIDYLSTVSGGGYIGSWLSAWIHRVNLRNSTPPPHPNATSTATSGAGIRSRLFAWIRRVLLATDGPNLGQRGADSPSTQNVSDPAPCRTDGVVEVELELAGKTNKGEEPIQLSFLRSYSNYLTPKVGLFSADTLAAIATYIRNLLLNVAILILYLSAGLLMVRGIAWLGAQVPSHETLALALSLTMLGIAVFVINLNIAYQLCPAKSEGQARRFIRLMYRLCGEERREQGLSRTYWVVVLIVIPLTAAAISLGYWLA